MHVIRIIERYRLLFTLNPKKQVAADMGKTVTTQNPTQNPSWLITPTSPLS